MGRVTTPVPRSAAALCAAALSCASGVRGQDLAQLPEPRADRSRACTSSDPAGGNEDSGHYLAVLPDKSRVLAEFPGPGRLARVWSADPRGDVRIEIDGAEHFRGPFRALFDGSNPPHGPPLAAPFAGGFLCFVPIPFRHRCRVTSPAGPGTYHHWTALLGPAPELVALPAPRPPVVRRCEVAGACELATFTGPGELVEIAVRIERADPRALWLCATADGATVPGLAAPLDLLLPGDLPTAATQGTGDGFVALHLPVPWRQRLVLAARHEGEGRALFDLRTRVRDLPADHRRHYLHAHFHRAANRWGEPFPVLRVDGRPGHLVGVVAELCGGPAQGLSFLEGDETVVADGETVLRGTGTEDFFGGGWYFRGNPASSPCAAVARIDERLCRVRAARWLLFDPIPFARDLRVDLEHGGGNDAAGSDYATLAVWYDDAAGLGRADLAGSLPANAPRPAPQWEDLEPAALFPGLLASAGAVELPPGEHHLPAAPAARCYTLRAAGRPVLPTLLAPAGERATLRIGAPLAVDEVRVEPALPAIRSWRIAGPFPGGGRRGLDRTHGPETDAGEARAYEVLGDGPRGWRAIEVPTASGVLDLDAAMGRRDEVVAFAATTLTAASDQDVVLWLGSDDAVRVYLDNVPVHERRGVRGVARDQDRVPLRLTQGEHLLLCEVEDYHGGFGLFARIDAASVTAAAFRAR